MYVRWLVEDMHQTVTNTDRDDGSGQVLIAHYNNLFSHKAIMK